LANIDFSDYIESLAHHLFHSYSANPELVTLTTDVSVSLDIDHAIPCGLIVNELLSNSLKYAFPDNRRGVMHLYFRPAVGGLKLRFSDDGIGLPEGMDFRNTDSLGLQLVTTLTSQLNGLIEHNGGVGTEFEITFPGSQTGRSVADKQ
jgi:two-component sensor histidine kinase